MAVDGLYRPDTKPPQTKIETPKTTAKSNTKFRFASSEPVSRTFDYKLESKGWKPCETPTEIKHLKEGAHKFKVRAVDAAGNVDPSPAKDKFKVIE